MESDGDQIGSRWLSSVRFKYKPGYKPLIWPVMNSSALIVGKCIFQKNPLLSSVNAVISTNERIEFIKGLMTCNPAYT